MGGNVSLVDGRFENAEHCVCCGAVIPEGSQVCIICGFKANFKQSIADVVEVRHGKWEYIGTDKHGNVFRCSCCALRIGLDYETTYCPHCGAKMDLEEENK